MSEKVMRDSVDFLLANRKEGHRARPGEDVNICYFGGEPTLNWDTIKQNIIYCKAIEKEKNIKFGLWTLTNALQLPGNDGGEDFLKTLNTYDVKVQISLDGCKKAHDTTRGHFDEIIKNVHTITSNFKYNVIVRMTVTPQNVHHAYESFRTMIQYSSVVNMVPIVEEIWTDDKIEIAKNQFEKIMNYAQRLSATKSIRFGIAEDCIDVGFRNCQVGGSMVTVAIDGSIYPCHRFQFHPNAETVWKMGDIYTGITRYPNFTNSFAKCFGCSCRTCHPCPSAFILSGNGFPPEHYCKYCKEIEKICLPVAREMREYTEKRIQEKMNRLMFKRLLAIEQRLNLVSPNELQRFSGYDEEFYKLNHHRHKGSSDETHIGC
jgi:uncharacterized protein